MSTKTFIFLLAIVPCFCQRPFYAGLRPIGFPASSSAGLSNRFENGPIPAELNGDREYASRLNSLPKENQPFFFVNRDQVANNLNNPQTYPLRSRGFNDNGRSRG
ncbi:unnamed protein product [Chrysodeixis includens]|uniref:Uncharacterized protein n=1 Tax=Chrysodeixis includens TaxID=689277 RepID=A0A9P0BTR3_CHRIL|nr:unnamed protein product [Chrysodeixis includens]